jgi:hypothetical protein
MSGTSTIKVGPPGTRRSAESQSKRLVLADPELDVAFKKESDREAARNFMDLLAASDAA